MLGFVVRRRPLMQGRHVAVVVPRADQQDIPHDDPPGRRAPARLEHHRAREVAPCRRHADIRRTEPEATRVPSQQCSEDTGRVHPWQAHPVDVTTRRHECRHLPVGEEAVVGDGHGSRIRGPWRATMRRAVRTVHVHRLPRPASRHKRASRSPPCACTTASPLQGRTSSVVPGQAAQRCRRAPLSRGGMSGGKPADSYGRLARRCRATPVRMKPTPMAAAMSATPKETTEVKSDARRKEAVMTVWRFGSSRSSSA